MALCLRSILALRWSAARRRGAQAGPRSNEMRWSSTDFLKPSGRRSAGRIGIPISCWCEFLRQVFDRWSVALRRKSRRRFPQISASQFRPHQPFQFPGGICETGPSRGCTCPSAFLRALFRSLLTLRSPRTHTFGTRVRSSENFLERIVISGLVGPPPLQLPDKRRHFLRVIPRRADAEGSPNRSRPRTWTKERHLQLRGPSPSARLGMTAAKMDRAKGGLPLFLLRPERTM